jgi:type II secretory pathway pseudopilin PulG
MNRKCKRKQRAPKGGEAGFTMVELVLVIVLTSILGMFGFQILTNSLLAQRNMQVRKEHSDDAVLALNKISSEIMVATAISTGSTLTLTLPTETVAYSVNSGQLERNVSGTAHVIAKNVASFNSSGTTSITVSLSFAGETGNRQTTVYRRDL